MVLFQLELDQIFCQSDIFVVIKSKCKDIGKSLQIKVADDAEAALMYYHDLTVFLYIPDILHDVVFLHPQPLFVILSSLISISLPKTIDHLKSNSVIVNQKAYRELKDEGCFKRFAITTFI